MSDKDKTLDRVIQLGTVNSKKWWIVWKEGSTHNIAGMRKHQRFEEAEAEAKRLCDRYPGTYRILEVVAEVSPGPPAITVL